MKVDPYKKCLLFTGQNQETIGDGFSQRDTFTGEMHQLNVYSVQLTGNTLKLLFPRTEENWITCRINQLCIIQMFLNFTGISLS